MGVGPLVSAAGLLLLLRLDAKVDYATDLLPALLLFSVGLSMTVAPLTATVLADADEHNAGVASGVNNAIARVGGLIAIAAVGAVVAAFFGARLEDRVGTLAEQPAVAAAVDKARQQPLGAVRVEGADAGVAARVSEAARDSSVDAFRLGMGISAALLALGGVLGLVGLRDPRRRVLAEDCPGGQLVGAPQDAARQSPCDWGQQAGFPAHGVPEPAR